MLEAPESAIMEENLGQGADTRLASPKKKRGRPCKIDTVLLPKEVAALGVPPSSDGMSLKERHNNSGGLHPSSGSNSVIGQTVHGVLDGSFDTGYLITVRVGESDKILRGLVFGPGLAIPRSKINDVASNVKQQTKRNINDAGSNVKKTKRNIRQTPPAKTQVTQSQVYKPVPITETAAAPTIMTDMEMELKNRLEVPPHQNECLGASNTLPEVSNPVDEDYKLEICDSLEAIKACLRNPSDHIQDDTQNLVTRE